MKLIFLKSWCLTLVFIGIMALNACKEKAPSFPYPPATPAAPNNPQPSMIVVHQNGDILLFGQKTDLDNLKKNLQDSLIKLPSVPRNISVKYEGEAAMGVREAVQSSINDAIKTALDIVQAPVLEALRIPVEKAMKLPIQFEVIDFKTVDHFVYVAGEMHQKDGRPIDFFKTPFHKQAAAGSFNSSFFGLLKNEHGTWNILTQTIGVTELPIACWWKEFSVPKALFNKHMVTDDCP
jgi:biopolymer transport protein ExbD